MYSKRAVSFMLVSGLMIMMLSSGCATQPSMAAETGSSSLDIATQSQQGTEDEAAAREQSGVSEEEVQGFVANLRDEYPNWDPDATHEYDPDYELSADEFASLVDALQTHLFEAEDGSVQEGYQTDSTELEVSGIIPNYYLKEDGTLDEDNVGKWFIVFDGGEPVVLARWSAWESGFDSNDSGTIHTLTLEGRNWKGDVTTTVLARLEAGATQLAFVSGSDETLLLDGDTLYETEFVLPAYGDHPILDDSSAELNAEVDLDQFLGGRQPSSGTAADLTGVQFGSVEPRQTFAYQTP